MARSDGGYAFPSPASIRPDGQVMTHPEDGMTYRDHLVAEMMVRWWAKTTNLTPQGKFWMALAGDDAIREAVQQAHKVADIMMEERYK